MDEPTARDGQRRHRWDAQPAVSVQDDLTVSDFDFNATNPLQSQLPQGAATINPVTGQPMLLKGGLVYANHGGPETPYKPTGTTGSRASGVTYRVNDWLGVRTNYGRSFLGSSGGQNGVYTTDFQRTTPFVAFAPNGSIRHAVGEPVPGWIPSAARRRARAAHGARHRADDSEPRLRDSIHRSVDGRRRHPAALHIGLDVAYVGNQVSKLGVTRPVNNIPRSENDKAIPSMGGNAGYLNQTFTNPFAGLIPGQGLNAATVSRGQLLRPYPHFTAFGMNRLNRLLHYNASRRSRRSATPTA